MTTSPEFGGWPETLGLLANRRDLSADQCTAVLAQILDGQATDAQISALIVGLRIKGETVAELAGLQRAMIAAAVPLTLPAHTIDIVGVGGAPSRRRHALNVSTMAAFVAAGAGASVCKHGNRKASSTSGSFDLLEALGVAVDVSPKHLEQQVANHGVGFAFARKFHPAMRHVGPVRAELGIPTVFNILGPLSHPGRLTRQVVGASDWGLARRMAETLRATGSVRSLIVHGDGGLDELTITGPSHMLSLVDDVITEIEVDATRFGLARATPADIAGGDAEANAVIARRVLAGHPGPARDMVVLNAAAGLIAAGVCDELGDGVAAAATAIDDGLAQAKLNLLASVNKNYEGEH